MRPPDSNVFGIDLGKTGKARKIEVTDAGKDSGVEIGSKFLIEEGKYTKVVVDGEERLSVSNYFLLCEVD